jgi:shikimate kinase
MKEHGYVTHDGYDHVLFVGFSGAGKSTTARRLSNWYRRPYVDIDRQVERALGASVDKLWAAGDQAAFRAAETAELERLKGEKSRLVACGSGIVDTPANLPLMKELGAVVYLKGTLADSREQIRNFDKRPDLTDPVAMRRLYEQRTPLYEELADYTFTISGKTFEEVAREVAGVLWEEGLL